MRKVLKVTIPLDDNIEKVQTYTQRMSYKKTYWHSIAPPHKIEYEFDGLSDQGILNIKEAFRHMFAESQYRSTCSFAVEEYER